MKYIDRLISMREFVLEIETSPINEKDWCKFHEKNLQKMFNYAKFLSQPLTLGMFVPTDRDGDVLEEPNPEHYGYMEGYGFEGQHGESSYNVDLRKYNEAKERVLFEGAKIWNHNGIDYLSIACKGYLIVKGVLFNDNHNSAPDKTNDMVEDLLEFSAPTLTETAKKQIYGNK